MSLVLTRKDEPYVFYRLADPPVQEFLARGATRLWRDSGYAFGALLAGFLADAFGLRPATLVIGLIALTSSALVAARMPETRPPVPELESA